MPKIAALGGLSSRGLGEFAQSQAQTKYIEDYFSTYLYDGTGAAQTITNNIPLTTTAAWSTAKLQLGTSRAYATTTDSSGNVYTTGHATDSGVTYCIIAKYSSSLSLQWKRKFSQNATVGRGIAVDSSGNVYVTGNASDGSNYIFVAKYDSSGAIQWQRKVRQNSSAATIGQAIAVSSAGNVYVVGTVFNAISGLQTFIVIKYNTSGTLQWQRAISDTLDSNGRGVALDSSENVYVTGRANDGSIDAIVVAKYNSSGTIQWNRKLRQGLSSYGYGIAVDSSSNVYVTGFATDTSGYIIVAKYNSSGAIQWQRKIKNLISSGWAISTDSTGNSYIAGTYNSAANMCVIKYDTSGSLQWQRNLTQTANNSYGISVYSNNVYVAGYGTDSANYAFTSVMPTDGTATAGTAFLTLTLGDGTDAAGTATDAVGTATDSAGAATDSAGTATDTTDNAVTSLATQGAVSSGSGLVWVKSRSGNLDHWLFDTSRGPTNRISSDMSDPQATVAGTLTSFNANGFSLGSQSDSNANGATFVSWTFRKQSKFFDVVTYTGNGANRTIAHSLGSVPGMILIKRTDAVADWAVYHRSLANTEYLVLDTTAAKATGTTYWNSTTPTSTVFSLGTSTDVNANGGTYVAYLFAHNAGGFGADGSQNVISCGSYTGTGASGNFINLGYEPQFLLIKKTDSAVVNGDWNIFDNMRGLGAASVSPPQLVSNSSAAENGLFGSVPWAAITSTGFNPDPNGSGYGETNVSGSTYIYLAIRRGPMKTPTDATKVFKPVVGSGNGSTDTGFPVDMLFLRDKAGGGANLAFDRLRGSTLALYTTSTSGDDTGFYVYFDSNSGANNQTSVPSPLSHNFRRAPGFFDVVCYSGAATAQNINHNLGIVPEMIMVKCRTSSVYWAVYHSALGPTKFIQLNTVNAPSTSPVWNNTVPTKSVFTVNNYSETGGSGDSYIAYLFASCPGVSKVGSYTGTGATQTINCGFTGGARYVLIRRTDSSGSWWVWDTARGMVAGTDPRLAYNSTAAEANADWVYTTTGGFQIVTSDATVNANGASYIFLAIS